MEEIDYKCSIELLNRDGGEPEIRLDYKITKKGTLSKKI